MRPTLMTRPGRRGGTSTWALSSGLGRLPVLLVCLALATPTCWGELSTPCATTTLAISLLSSSLFSPSLAQLPPPSVSSLVCPSESCTESRQRRSNESAVRIGVILPSSSLENFGLYYNMPALEIAKETIEDDPDLLANRTIELEYRDSSCSETYAPLAGIDLYLNKAVDVFIGPACNYALAPLARFVTVWDVPIMTAGGLVRAFENKTEFRLLTRMMGDYTDFSMFCLRLMEKFEWYNVGMLYHFLDSERTNQWFMMEALFKKILEYRNPKLKESIAHTFNMYRYTTTEIEKSLLELSTKCRGKIRTLLKLWVVVFVVVGSGM